MAMATDPVIKAVSSGIEKDYGWMKGVFCRRKTLKAILEEASRDQEMGSSKLGLFDLLCIGIGATIGSGVFALTGEVACYSESADGTLDTGAGPSAVLSWMMAGFACFLSAFAYMELSARLPTKGSCYTFSYHCLGELPAVIGSVCLTMEYGMSASGVARSWSSKLSKMFGPGFAKFVHGGPNDQLDYCAAVITLLSALLVMGGLNCGKIIINGFTMMKVMLVLFLIFAGFAAAEVHVFASAEAFFPFGLNGTIKGSSKLFFGFIGFDEVCCMAAKARDPAKTMPRALAGTLIGAVLFSGLAQLSLSVMGPECIEEENTIGLAFAEAFETVKHWQWAAWITHVGEAILLPLVVLLSLLPQPEVTAAMAEDKLLPSIFARANDEGVFVQGAAIIGAIFTLLALAVPFGLLWDVINFGVLMGFNLTNASLLMCRYGNGGRTRSKRAAVLVWALLACTGLFSYFFWLGWARPLLLGMEYSTRSIVFSSIFLATCLIITLLLQLLPQIGDVKDSDTFRAPGVPYIPALAMMANYIMMAQQSWQGHLNFLIFVVIIVFLYIAYTGTKRAIKSGRTVGDADSKRGGEDSSEEEDSDDDDDAVDSGSAE